MGPVHTMNVNAPAMTASATPACAARADTAPSMSAPLELDDADVPVPAGAGEPELEAVVTPDDTAAARGVAVVDTTAEEGVTEEAEPEAGTAEVPFELGLPPGRYDGGGTALDGSARAPAPQGIGSPSGWVGFGAGTVAPVESAMAKRPVQIRSEALAAWENW